MIKRQDILGNVNDSTNVTDSNGVSQYDQLNRPMLWEQTATVDGTHNSVFARSHFGYDNLSRLTASWRDEQAGKGEWFGYHATGQLTDVAYNADNVSSGTPQNATRTVNYAMTPDTLNRSTMADTGELSVYTPNALNQYTDVNGGGIYYDDKFNLMWTGGFSAGYDSENNLTAIASGEDYAQFVYDGLGRCVKRTIDWETTLITYDGWQPIAEWDEWNNLKAWNVYGAGPDEILTVTTRSGEICVITSTVWAMSCLFWIATATVLKGIPTTPLAILPSPIGTAIIHGLGAPTATASCLPVANTFPS